MLLADTCSEPTLAVLHAAYAGKVQSRACHPPCKQPHAIHTVASSEHIKRACSLQDTLPHRTRKIGITLPLTHPANLSHTCDVSRTQ